MSVAAEANIDEIRRLFAKYAPSTGPDRYARFVEEVLGLQRTYVQDHILEALHEHEQVVTVAANGVGKSYIAAAGGVAALHCNADTIVNVTAGTSGTLKTNIWKPARSLYRNSFLPELLGGRTMDGDREIRTGLDDEWFFECVSPRYPDDLEGPHNDHLIYIIEEADKPGVTADHLESVRSTTTDENDRILVIANPPTQETNIVYELLESDEWHTLQFPTWECHNVRRDRGLTDAPRIGGLATTHKLKQDWAEYHGEPWPGLERAIELSSPYLDDDGHPVTAEYKAATTGGEPRPNPEFDDTLDELWFKRRVGIRPPSNASLHRPIDPDLVERAYQPDATPRRQSPEALGVDVARSGDDTVAAGPHDAHLVVHYAEQGTDHTEQEQALAGQIREWPPLGIAVDAVGEGSGLADGLDNRFGSVHRFKNSAVAANATRYDRCWGESLALFADYLAAGGTFASRELYEQAKVAARTVTWTEKELSGRGVDGAKVLSASSKDEIRDRLGRSPDHLDAALMAVWMRDADREIEQSSTWYSP